MRRSIKLLLCLTLLLPCGISRAEPTSKPSGQERKPRAEDEVAEINRRQQEEKRQEDVVAEFSRRQEEKRQAAEKYTTFSALLSKMPVEARPDPHQGWDNLSLPKAQQWVAENINDKGISISARLKLRFVNVAQADKELKEGLLQFNFENDRLPLEAMPFLVQYQSEGKGAIYIKTNQEAAKRFALFPNEADFARQERFEAEWAQKQKERLEAEEQQIEAEGERLRNLALFIAAGGKPPLLQQYNQHVEQYNLHVQQKAPVPKRPTMTVHGVIVTVDIMGTSVVVTLRDCSISD